MRRMIIAILLILLGSAMSLVGILGGIKEFRERQYEEELQRELNKIEEEEKQRAQEIYKQGGEQKINEEIKNRYRGHGEQEAGQANKENQDQKNDKY